MVATIDSSIFSRSQNDDDFLLISLGISDQIKPLFEIKYEKKSLVVDDTIQYKLSDNPNYHGNPEECPFNFELIIPDSEEDRKKMSSRLRHIWILLKSRIQNQHDEIEFEYKSISPHI